MFLVPMYVIIVRMAAISLSVVGIEIFGGRIRQQLLMNIGRFL
jgi:hypothetical protein